MQTFFLKIDAESPDGQAVKCETQIKTKCTKTLGAHLIANLIKQDEQFREMIIEAIAICAIEEDFREIISDEEYESRLKNDPPAKEDLDL